MSGFLCSMVGVSPVAAAGGFTAPTAAFTDDSNTKLLLHFNGTNGATSTTDDNSSGRTAKTITMNSSVLSTTQKKFGTAALYVDGTGGDYVWTDDSGDWDLSNSRTFETWVYINSFTNISRNAPNHIPKLMGHMNQSGTIWWAFGPNTEGGLTLYYWRGGNDWTHSTTKDLVTGQWYHIALVINSSGVAKGYVNGVEYLSETLTSPSAGNTAFAIGAEFGQSMNAYIDEFRVSNLNRYT
jgi:hypothetical protein